MTLRTYISKNRFSSGIEQQVLLDFFYCNPFSSNILKITPPQLNSQEVALFVMLGRLTRLVTEPRHSMSDFKPQQLHCCCLSVGTRWSHHRPSQLLQSLHVEHALHPGSFPSQVRLPFATGEQPLRHRGHYCQGRNLRRVHPLCKSRGICVRKRFFLGTFV
jgi:hypothetical protein